MNEIEKTFLFCLKIDDWQLHPFLEQDTSSSDKENKKEKKDKKKKKKEEVHYLYIIIITVCPI